MGKLTARLIKYFIGTISFVILICFTASSIFLSLVYTNMQYASLKTAAKAIHSSIINENLSSDIASDYQISSAVLVKDGSVHTLTATKMGMMPLIRNMNFLGLSEKGRYRNQMNEEFIYYKYSSDIGDIIVLRNNNFSETYLKTTYIILLIIFFIALIISIPIVAYLGKKLTKPILKLQKVSLDITHGKYDIDINVNTKDEIEDLAQSLKFMADTIERKTKMQRDFIANVSHDFKTPLSIIRNYSEAIKDNIIGEEDRKSFSEEIMKEVDRLNLLVMDILQLSKLQGGNEILKRECFNLSEFLLSFQNTFKMLTAGKNIDLKIDVPHLDFEVDGDVNYLYRVVYNLIDNAIKFSGENSEVIVKAREIEDGIKISVIDYGEGIENSYIDDIWNRYYKNNKSGGMGLGLAICSEILKLHGFDYGVNSEPGVKTEFYFIVSNCRGKSS
jgi:signal transduction histidine kinase